MLVVKSFDVRSNFKEWCNRITNGEIITVSRPKNQNVIMMSESEYHDIMDLANRVEKN